MMLFAGVVGAIWLLALIVISVAYAEAPILRVVPPDDVWIDPGSPLYGSLIEEGINPQAYDPKHPEVALE